MRAGVDVRRDSQSLVAVSSRCYRPLKRPVGAVRCRLPPRAPTTKGAWLRRGVPPTSMSELAGTDSPSSGTGSLAGPTGVCPAPLLPPLVVFDFDWSLINENSDTYVVEQLDPSGVIIEKLEKQVTGGMPWTECMDWVAGQLHAAGHDATAFAAALARVPVLRGALEAVALAREHGADLRILSDANELYIRWILTHLGLAEAFTTVETNGAVVEPTGRLRIRPHQPLDSPHGCPRCPPNLCKGAVLSNWLSEGVVGTGQPRRCVYVGDGGGDFCPAMRLSQDDTLLARRAPHDGLLRKIRASGRAPARVVEWSEKDDGASLLAGFREHFACHALPPQPLTKVPRSSR